MSLFDSIASKVAPANIISKLSTGLTSRIPSVGAIGGAVGGALVGKFVPKKLQGTVNRALRGDVGGAISDGIGNFITGEVAEKLGKLRLLGGISLEEAGRLMAEVQATNYAKKNLFFITFGEIETEAGYEDMAHAFNMFAVDVAYSPGGITSEAKAIGMGVMDVITGADRAEVRITTYDDARGTIRGWFEAKLKKVKHHDGTVGTPFQYMVKIAVSQSATDEVGAGLFGRFQTNYLMRPVDIDYELSRAEDGLQQIQMTFAQFDTFMFKPKGST